MMTSRSFAGISLGEQDVELAPTTFQVEPPKIRNKT